jgi:DNA topoisomerase-1
MKNLVIVESPSKSKTIMKYLGPDFDVVSSKGHIRDLATTGKGKLGVDIAAGFKPTYVVSEDKSDVVKALKAKVKTATTVYLATDPDREGEAISWHLADELGLDLDKTQRVVFNEITKTAILEAFNHPRHVDMDMVRSQEARRILDRILGFKLSKLLQTKIKSRSAGRVQSVALKLIVERENEINKFIPVEKWAILAKFIKDGIEFDAELSKFNGKSFKVSTKEETDMVMSKLTPEFTVTSIEEKDGKAERRYPYITSTLQQDAANKLFFSAKKTMNVAQKLYDGSAQKNGQEGLITYMRTDSTRLSDQFIQETLTHIESTYGKAYLGSYKVKNEDNSQDAHEAIRPTHIALTPESLKDSLSDDAYKLYALIYSRALASLMSAPKIKNMTVLLSQSGYDFSAKGSKVDFDGFYKVLGKYEQRQDKMLPKLSLDEKLNSLTTEGKQSFTNPPSRYTEAKLIEVMEENGIGRPSTYATIVDTIVERAYVTLDKTETSKVKYFFPTEQGLLTDTKLGEHFSDVINVEYTAKMEEQLDQIAEGKLNQLEALSSFYSTFDELMKHANENMEKIQPIKTGRECPQCGHELVIRKGRFGDFTACSDYPTCKYIEKSENDKKEPELTGDDCPTCGKPLVKRIGKFGPFVSCSDYPTCKYIMKDSGPKAAPVPTGEKCPVCGGDLVTRKGRFGPFVSCGNYPKCKYIKPREKKEAVVKAKDESGS